jgi:ABC-type uncharacterized transport system permease subunit
MHKKQVRIYTCSMYILFFTCIPAMITLFTGLSNQYIDISFAIKENQNTVVIPIMNDTISSDPLPMDIYPEIVTEESTDVD